MAIKPERKKKCNTRYVLLYAFPTASVRNRSYRLLIFEELRYQRKCQSEEILKQLNLMNSTRQEANDADGYFQAWPSV